MIGSSQPIVATQGDDVILPCHVEPPVEEDQLTVEWWRPDLPPDPGDPRSLDRYVHRYHDNRDEEDMKMPMYAGRTTLFREELRHCNVSLKIMDLKLSDGGWYRCFLPQLKSPYRRTDINLSVETRMTTQEPTSQPTTPVWKDETEARGRRGLIAAVVVFVLLVLGGGGTLLFKHVRNKQVSSLLPSKSSSEVLSNRTWTSESPPPGPAGLSDC